jgi:tetratricopeptide (TPR) repeat protein
MGCGITQPVWAQDPCGTGAECLEKARAAKDWDTEMLYLTQAIDKWTEQEGKAVLVEALMTRGKRYLGMRELKGTMALGDFLTALEDFRRAKDLDPTNADAFWGFGTVLARSGIGNLDTAGVNLKKAIELNPHHVEARYNLAQVYLTLEQQDNALKELSDLIHLLPSRSYDEKSGTYSFKMGITGIPSKQVARFFGDRGRVYLIQKKYEEAYQDFNSAIKENADYAEAYYYRAYLLFYIAQDYDKAFEDATRAIELRADIGGPPYYYRGYYYYNKGQYDPAIIELNKAIAHDPKDAESYFIRGYCYWEKQQTDLTIQDFKKAVDLGHAQARDVLRQYFNITY